MIIKPKGTHDISGIDAKKWEYVSRLISDICTMYNYDYIRTPIFESSDLFHRGIGEGSDIVTKETYDFKDRGDRNLTLRPEGTAGVARWFIENKMYGNPTLPVKVYYNGTMYRYERPQSGRDRELTQYGVEVLGTNDPLSDAEVIALSYNIFKMIGIPVTVNINSLGDNDSRNNYRDALKKYFSSHLDEVCEDCKMRFDKNPLRMLDCKVDKDSDLFKNVPSILDYLNEDSKKRFDEVLNFLNIMGINYKVNDKIVRGLDYYNHTVFEIEAEVSCLGAQNVLGAGGRYNNLIEDLGGPNTPGIGFAGGLGRLIIAIDALDIKLPINDKIDVFIMYVSEEEKQFAANLLDNLRLFGIRTETDYLNRSIKAQFNQADRLGARYLIILNEANLKDAKVTIKDNKTKEEELVDIDYIAYYLEEKLSLDDDSCNCGGDCDCNNHDHNYECTCHKEKDNE